MRCLLGGLELRGVNLSHTLLVGDAAFVRVDGRVDHQLLLHLWGRRWRVIGQPRVNIDRRRLGGFTATDHAKHADEDQPYTGPQDPVAVYDTTACDASGTQR